MIYLHLLGENVKQYFVFVCVRIAGMENSYHKIIVFCWHKRETVTERHERERVNYLKDSVLTFTG